MYTNRREFDQITWTLVGAELYAQVDGQTSDMATHAQILVLGRHEKSSKPSADTFLGNLKFPQIESLKFPKL